MFSKAFLLSLVKAFIVSFVGAFVVSIEGILAAPDLNAAKSLALAAAAGAVGVAARVVLGLFIAGEHPLPEKGVVNG